MKESKGSYAMCGTCNEFICGSVHICQGGPLEREIKRLREDCAAAYQIVGHLAAEAELFETDAVEHVLDNLDAASSGDPRPHEWARFAPVRPLFFSRIRSAWRVLWGW